ncbi:hypothetical protein [Microcoleus sp. B3-D7]|uniref:hypothetical protein n=1 Tax=Microcoleus sp. B3-D7 TaxID=2818659 RepID=UPI002FD18716
MNGNLYFCRTDSSNSAFILKSHDKIGFGIYIEKALEEEQDAEKLAEYKRQREIDKKLRLERETKDRAQLLSDIERDKEIRKILGQLTLNPNHREDLKRRGLSDEQIQAGMFRSVSPYQKLQTAVSSNLAGVSIDTNGRSLTNTESGYICPVWSGSGLIVGWQLRLDNTEDNGKYKWPTSRWRKRPNGPTSHLQNGEMPITVCRPEVIDPSFTSIGLAEGILKPKIAAELSGQFFLGAAGGLFASSPKTFKQELDKLSAELGTKTIILYPDAGSPGNKDIMREYAKTYRLVTSWGYELRIGWWGQVEKSDISGIDDLLAAGEAERKIELFWDDFEAFSAGKAAKDLKIYEGLLNRKHPKPLKASAVLTSDRKVNDATLYYPGERLAIWKKNAAASKFIIDSSDTGTGKSYDTGLCFPADFDCDRIIYISKDHRNASTPSLKDWEDLEARHNGLTIDNLGNWRRAKTGDRIEAAANCDRTQLSAVLREKNISGSDTAGLMCPTCPHFEGCRAGEKFGFLKARSQALKAERLRVHPDSLPPTDSFGYAAEGKTKGTVLVWEEWSESLKYSKDITVEEGDITHITSLLLSADTEAFGLTDLLVKLWELVAGKHQIPRWGLPHDRLLEILLPLIKGNVDVDAIAEVTNPNDQVQAILHGLGEHGVSLQDLPANLRKSFASSDADLADKAQKIAKQWLKPFLQVITGNHPGYLNLNGGALSITVADRRLIEIAHAAKANIFLDATGSPNKLALMLGIENEDISHIQQATSKKAELIIKQIVDHGRLGIFRGAEQVRAIEAIVAAIRQEDPAAAVIDFKKFTSMEEALNLKWFSESRGSNLAQSAKTLILVGTPCRPIATLAAEFTLLYGRSPNITSEKTTRQMILSCPAPKGESDIITSNESVDIEFRGYIYKDIHANIDQAMGRLRANRRAGETLTIYFISNFVLDMPVELVRAVDICLEAATPIQKLELAIGRCVEELKAKNEKLTLTAIADFCKVSKQRLSQLVKELGYSTAAEFKKSLVLLLESHSKTRQNSKGYIPLSAEKQIDLWAAQIGSLPKSVIFALLEGASNTLAPPQSETKPLMPITLWTGWVNRWGELHKARFKSWCENGTRWVVEYLENSGQLGETQVDPKNFVWAEGGASC